MSMELHNIREAKEGYTTWGCMWKEGECIEQEVKSGEKRFLCRREDGGEVPLQSRVTAYWPDGSVKWTAHTADAALLGRKMRVEISEQGKTVVENPLRMEKNGCSTVIYAGNMELHIAENSDCLFEQVKIDGVTRLSHAQPVLEIEEPCSLEGGMARLARHYKGKIEKVIVEEWGEQQAVLKYEGIHVSEAGMRKLPFFIRMTIDKNGRDIRFMHTFLYDGDEERDYLKGIGIAFKMPVQGALYNRHIKFTGDNGVFHEALAPLLSWRPRVPEGIYERQMQGEALSLTGEEKEIADKVLEDMPHWSEYTLCQDSVSHFVIRKKIADDNCCFIDCLHGVRTAGGSAFGSSIGSVLVGVRDFWEKYPTGYDWKDLEKDVATCAIWFWSPEAEAMDFRHYANRGYNQVCYEGYDYKGATPVGIACTNECAIRLSDAVAVQDVALEQFIRDLNKPALYVGTPQFYHEMRAFGYWSLPSYGSPTEKWLEEQLDRAVAFYLQEVEQRGWYGMFHYGDFMHTYDGVRHQWRYDIGGYAWDNTELVPTLWLWLSFLRSGREDIFSLAQKLSRHTSEVDVYHLGKYKGLGSRHNVRHWGCPCKEARIAMAAHHRFLYYLTGDRRLGDIFEEWQDNEESFYAKDPLGDFYQKEEMVYKSHARSGPDWSALCSNWMTQWERQNDIRYRDKMKTGLEDIKKMPLQLISGPDFEFDPETCHLRYIGERTTGGSHLQVCMGAPQVWLEAADLLKDEEFHEMLAALGRFYYLPREKQLEESEGIIGDREFTLPFMCAALGAYGAKYKKDRQLAMKTWEILLQTLIYDGNQEGFQTIEQKNCGNREILTEIPWISTNFAAQWCLNVIMALEFIREALPRTMEDAQALTAEGERFLFRKA